MALPCTWRTNSRSLLRRLHGGDGYRPGQPRRVPAAPRCQPPGLPQDHRTRPRCAQPPHQSLCMKPASLQRAMGRTPCVLFFLIPPSSVRHIHIILFQTNTHTYITERVLGNRLGEQRQPGSPCVTVAPVILVMRTAQFQTRALSTMSAVQTRRHGLRRNIAATLGVNCNQPPPLVANRNG